MKYSVGILLFDDVEVLDFAGPFEVFSVCSQLHNHELFEVFTIAQKQTITAVNGLSVNAAKLLSEVDTLDILIVPGGNGSKALLTNQEILSWIEDIHKQTKFTLSVCSGARLLGALGLLDGKPYCTHQGVYAHMEELVPTGLPQKHLRFTQTDKIYTSGGISAGIDLSFHILETIFDKSTALKTAAYMEYDWPRAS